MMDDLAPKLSRSRVAWGGLKSTKDVVEGTKNTSLSVTEHKVERTMLEVSRHTRHTLKPMLRYLSRIKIKVVVLYAQSSEIRWSYHALLIMDNRCTIDRRPKAVSNWIPQNLQRTAGRALIDYQNSLKKKP